MEDNDFKIATFLANNSGTSLIQQERQRQIEKEGYDYHHDDAHINEEIALAAVCYAIPYTHRFIYAGAQGRSNIFRVIWPWEQLFWKPAKSPTNTDQRIRELTKAGALIAAEIDRLQRSKFK